MTGIIGAMEEEVAQLREDMEEVEEVIYAKITFWKGRLCGEDIVLVYSGIGKVNAAICAQLLITVFGVKRIIFVGVAGGIHPEVNLGDVIISKDALQHDVDVTGSGHDYGKIPRLQTNIFSANDELIRLAVQAGQSLSEEETPPRIHIGRILSGDQYICNTQKARWLYEYFKGHCVEMEGGAVAHVCYLNEIPFVIIRSISDKADDAAEETYLKYSQLALRNSYRMVKRMLQELKNESALD